MSKSTGYSLTGYGDMITDKPRMDAYVQALKQIVEPGSNVLDIGAGTGIFSLLACQLGARHVDAVELDDAIKVAEVNAAQNGYTDRITFHQALSTSITLPQRADIIVSDLRGVLPLYQQHIPSIVDARSRLLKAGGNMIPQSDTIFAALVEAPKTYLSYEEPWLFNDHDLDMRAGQKMVVNNWQKVNFTGDQLLVPAQLWATLDYTNITDPNVEGELEWHMEKTCIAHGIAVWFETKLGEGIGFSNAPGHPGLIYGQAFFPLQRPVTLTEGDKVKIQLQASLVEDDYVWLWNTRVINQENPDTLGVDFHQSTFYGAPFSHGKIKKKASAYIPLLKVEGQMDRIILDRMDGNTPLSEIAQQILELFPDRFRDWKQALTHVGKLAQKYS